MADSLVRHLRSNGGMRNPWILIVDDDANFCRSLLRALETRRIQAASCHRATVALDLLRSTRSKPSVLVTDAHLPDLTGLELVRALADDGIRLPTLLVSGIGATMPVGQLRKMGCHGFLEKPFPAAVFLKEVLVLLPSDDEEPGDPKARALHNPIPRRSVQWDASVRF